MPELPEVEVTRRSFADQIVGAEILTVRLGKPLRWPLGVPSEALHGRHVVSVRRRGKYLLLDLDRGLLMLHLGMSGSIRFAKDLPPYGPYDHFDLHTTQGILRLKDPRRFGAAMFLESENDLRAVKLLGALGMEPLSEQFNVVMFTEQLKRRRSAIKQVLLSGKVVVGLGNIYASEALFHARIHPEKSASRLTHTQIVRLWRAIKNVMTDAIEQGGSTLRNYSDARGGNGHFQLHAMVYGRKGQSCQICGNPIEMIRQGQRSTFFCAGCQKRE